MPSKTRKAAIQPDNLYPLETWRHTSGIGRNSEARARRMGIYLPVLQVGRCKFVRGSDGIEYLHAVAESGL
jgi:hypothetical protein